ncbi:hypothetical protein A9Q84_00940 [Halobacteriovorax marinus]|uniref:Uncharacterized protein n=1 Tax=Halobacteriovorax marinus TaxID=97084 RepID=A0A1Y5FID1_9BACT|nr:hypothetical protein A9Q84_00940 [Halobacteriovorax marinus]
MFGATLTAIALIISLASNLYTPGLVKVFVRHPLIITGLSIILFNHMVLILVNLVPVDHAYFTNFIQLSYMISCFSMAAILPFLYYISQFLRPSYFLPLLATVVTDSLDDLNAGHDLKRNYTKIFDTLDTIANISLTASSRDDRQLMILVSDMIHECQMKLITDPQRYDAPWRNEFQKFIPGHSDVGKEYLIEHKCWPEAYIMGKYHQILKGIDKDQDEVISKTCENLVESLIVSIENKDNIMIEFHLMLVNRLTEIAILQEKFERIQSLSHYFKNMIKLLSHDKENLNLAFHSWFHFAELAYQKDIHFAYETYLYDSGHLLLEFSSIDQEQAGYIFDKFISKFWKDALKDKGKHEIVTKRVAVKTYWNSRSLGHNFLANSIHEMFLMDDINHRTVLTEILKYKTPLHWSFSERLLRFNYLDDKSSKLAHQFLDSKAA